MLLILLALPMLALPTAASGAGIIQPAASACTAATYASLPAGQPDGTLCEATDTGMAWEYDTASGLWLIPGVNPSALLVDYTGAALPADSTPAWTKVGTQSEAVAGGILTLTDASATDLIAYYWTDATNLVKTKNIGIIIRAKVDAQSSGTNDAYKVWTHLKPSATTDGLAMGLAAYAAVSAVGNLLPGNLNDGTSVLKPAGGVVAPTYSPDNAEWQTYYLLWRKDSLRYEIGVLGGPVLYSLSSGSAYVAAGDGGLEANGIRFGCGYFGTCTVEIDYLKVFNW